MSIMVLYSIFVLSVGYLHNNCFFFRLDICSYNCFVQGIYAYNCFVQGIYTADLFEKSRNYCHNYGAHSDVKFMLVCEVSSTRVILTYFTVCLLPAAIQ